MISSIFGESLLDTADKSYQGTNEKSDESESQSLLQDESPKLKNESYAVQIGTFLKENSAEQKIIELQNKGFDPYIFQSLNSKNQTVFAVRIGKYENYQSADDAASQLRSDLNTSVLIAYYDSLETASSSATPANTFKAMDEEPVSAPHKELASNQVDSEPQQSESGEVQEESEGPPTLENLQKKIKSLESTINSLKDESEVRKQLEVTEEEAKAEEEDILEAAGREYTLTRSGNIQFQYGFGYSYNEFDALKQSVRVEDVADHTISNSFSVYYGLRDNLSLGAGIPFVYAYQKVGTVDSLDVTDLGDLSLSWQYQPLKSSSDLPTFIVNGTFSVPVGRGPYEIRPGEELSTSSGIYQNVIGLSVSQVADPVVVFSSLNANIPLTVTNINQKRTEGILDEVNPGNSIGVGAGMGYALSYKLNLNASFGYTYAFETKYKYKNSNSVKSGTDASATFNLGVGYKWSPRQNLNFRIGFPVTESRQFSFSFTTPVEFEL